MNTCGSDYISKWKANVINHRADHTTEPTTSPSTLNNHFSTHLFHHHLYKMALSQENRLQMAIIIYKSQKIKSEAKAAAVFGVPKTTLHE
jgi:hypothetical protein